MSAITAPHAFWDEWTRLTAAARAPEPEAMEALDQVEAYTAAGSGLHLMTATHLFHTAQATPLIRPGDRVLDLGCGPGQPLLGIARLRPEADFLGLDLSTQMLDQAERNRTEQGLSNVTLAEGEITRLDGVADQSIDVAVSCMTLHHLPGPDPLRRCFAAIRRVLRPGGRVYLADFRRPRSPVAARWVAHRRAGRQPEAFTRDFENSLRAAFSCRELADAAGGRLPGRWYRQRLLPLMTAIKSGATKPVDATVKRDLERQRRTLPAWARQDLSMIRLGFRAGGLRSVV